jgi:two-component sensor histidine kinase
LRYLVILNLLVINIFAQNQVKIDSLQQVLKGNLSKIDRSQTTYRIANQYVNFNTDSAKKYLDLTFKAAKLSGNFTEIGLAHKLNTDFLQNSGFYDEAVGECIKAIEYLEKDKNLLWLGKVYSSLGYIYKRMSNAQNIIEFSKKGLFYAEKSVEILLKTDDFDAQAGAFINLGIIQRDLKDFIGARESFLKGLNINKLHKVRNVTLAILYADYGQNFIDFGKDYDKAIYYLKKAIELYKIENYKRGIEHAHRNLADAYRLKKDFKNAILHGEESVKVAKEVNDKNRIFNAYNALFQANEAAGDYKSAFENLKIAKMFEDSTLRVEKVKSIAEIETKYQTVKKEAEIAVLGEKNKAQNRTLMILLSGLLIAVGFLAAIYWQNQKIKESRKQISEQSDQLKLMMKELHHRVKNNLAIVSGLLRIQSNKLEDESAIQAVRQGQQRVDAMSLIHQRLYQTDKITTINIKEYMTDLAESLMSAYGFENNNFDLNIEVEKEELDVDLAIPLGLIINELLTNSFKYAYANIEKPTLNISLKGDKNLELEIKDNGIGIDLDKWKNAKDSFGKKMIAGLVKQIGGVFTIENDEGTVFRMRIAA